MTKTIEMIDHYAGRKFTGTFREVLDMGGECIAGVTEIEVDEADAMFVATILHDGSIFTYHDWQTPWPEEICAAPEDTGAWLHNATGHPAIWLDGKPSSVSA